MTTKNSADDDLADDILWGVPGPNGIAAFINRTERETYYLVETGQLPAKKLGPKKIIASRRALRKALQGE